MSHIIVWLQIFRSKLLTLDKTTKSYLGLQRVNRSIVRLWQVLLDCTTSDLKLACKYWWNFQTCKSVLSSLNPYCSARDESHNPFELCSSDLCPCTFEFSRSSIHPYMDSNWVVGWAHPYPVWAPTYAFLCLKRTREVFKTTHVYLQVVGRNYVYFAF